MNPYTSPILLCWADRLALVWLALVAFCMIALAGTLPFSGAGLWLLFICVMPVWIIARGIDWICDGPSRRYRLYGDRYERAFKRTAIEFYSTHPSAYRTGRLWEAALRAGYRPPESSKTSVVKTRADTVAGK